MSAAVQKLAAFWQRYEKLGLRITFILISLQLIHLYWLTADVVIKRIADDSSPGLSQNPVLFLLFIVIDYVEIPALVSGLTYYSLTVYKDRRRSGKEMLLLVMLALQVFHIFWITDEVVYETFFGASSAVEIPYYAAWIAILVDYLELPVIVDLFYRTIVKGERR